jgi:DNA helicase-2/ATP-dependent DNA helicase PcrA
VAFLDELNPQQRQAVEHDDGPLLVVAGAGSGKTRVITYRIAHLISKGVPPRSILGVTFTNKAAGEMRERVERMVERAPLLCTFHSFCARLLRQEAPRLGFQSDYTIYDETDSENLIRRVVKDLKLEPKEFPASAVKAEIERAKIAMLDPEAYAASRRYGFGKTVGAIYTEYQARLRRANAMDFDDLLMYAVAVLRDHAEVRERWRRRYRTLLVDEFQDTNPPQYMLVKLLGAPDGNVCAVGDPDQSIYQWRGANIAHIRAFEEDFSGVRLVTLEQNYRSTPTILRAANAVIGHNTARHPKSLWSERAEGAAVSFRECLDEYDEADYVAEQIRRLARGRLERREIAVFYRTNAQSRVFEEVLMSKRIPYVVVGTVGFYQRKEVKDVLAYVRLVVNPADIVSLERIINVPPRGIGATTLDRLRAHAAERLLTPQEALTQAGAVEGLTASARKAVAAFAAQLERFRGLAEELGPADLARLVVDETGYVEMLTKSRDEQAPDRIENVEELLDAITRYEETTETPTLRGFLENVALMSDIDGWEAETDRVNLMTAHNSKGLEFAAVFVTGLEEGLLPHANSLDSRDGLEEERRLFYVALTRAKDRVLLSGAETRTRFGQQAAQIRSRFVEELPKDELELDDGLSPKLPAAKARAAKAREETAYACGDRVVHPTFGEGEVLEVETTSCGQVCSIRFGDETEPRAVAVRFARMTKLS